MENKFSTKKLIEIYRFFAKPNSPVEAIFGGQKYLKSEIINYTFEFIKDRQYPGLTRIQFEEWSKNPETIINILNVVSAKEQETKATTPGTEITESETPEIRRKTQAVARINAKEAVDAMVSAAEARAKVSKATNQEITYRFEPKKPLRPMAANEAQAKEFLKVIENPQSIEKTVRENLSGGPGITPEVLNTYTPEVIESFIPLVSSEIRRNIAIINTSIEKLPTEQKLEFLLNHPQPTNAASLLINMAEQIRVTEKAAALKFSADLAHFHSTVHDFTALTYGTDIADGLFGPKDQQFKQVVDPNENTIDVNLSKFNSLLGEYAKMATATEGVEPRLVLQDSLQSIQAAIQAMPRPSPSNFFEVVSSISSDIFKATGTSLKTNPALLGGLPKYFGLSENYTSLFESKALSILGYDAKILAGHQALNFRVAAQISKVGTFSMNFSGGALTLGFQKVGSAIAGKGATIAIGETVGKVAARAIGAKAGAAFGVVVGNVVGLVIGAVIGWLSEKLLPLIKKYAKYLTLAGFVPLVFGLMSGTLPLTLLGGAMIGGGIAAGTTLSGMAGLLGIGLGSVFGEMLKPLIAFLIGFPVLLAIILFIINSGAYVVPPSESLLVSPSLGTGITAAGQCPVVGDYFVSTTAYNPNSEAGHGSNAYWNAVVGKGNESAACYFNIPIPGMSADCRGPNSNEIVGYNPDNYCAKRSDVPKCPYYGLATDVSATPGTPIIAPTLCDPGTTTCPTITWTVEQAFWNCTTTSPAYVPGSSDPCNSSGQGIILNSTGNGHSWRIYLTHIDILAGVGPGSTIPSGSQVGTISPKLESGPHLHIELNQDGVPIVPDFLCSGQSASTVPKVDLSCFEFSEGWSQAQEEVVKKQLSYLIDKHPAYIAKPCINENKIALKRAPYYCGPNPNDCVESPTDPASSRRNAGSQPGSITFFNALFETSSENGILRVLTHELAHQIQFKNPDFYKRFLNEVAGKEKVLPGYRFSTATNINWEDFAETAATYLDFLEIKTSNVVPNLPDGYPLHFNFAKTVLFEE